MRVIETYLSWLKQALQSSWSAPARSAKPLCIGSNPIGASFSSSVTSGSPEVGFSPVGGCVDLHFFKLGDLCSCVAVGWFLHGIRLVLFLWVRVAGNNIEFRMALDDGEGCQIRSVLRCACGPGVPLCRALHNASCRLPIMPALPE
jgi:hypothetical protein